MQLILISMEDLTAIIESMQLRRINRVATIFSEKCPTLPSSYLYTGIQYFLEGKTQQNEELEDHL